MVSRVRLNTAGTRWRTGGEVKGKLANGVGSQYSSHYLGTASSRIKWRPRWFKWTRPFRRKTKSDFCACAITFEKHYTSCTAMRLVGHEITWRLEWWQWYTSPSTPNPTSEIHFVHTDDFRYMRFRYPRYFNTYSKQLTSSLLITIPRSHLLIMTFRTILTVLLLIYL